MINYSVVRSNELIEVVVKGHAGYADPGMDIVCASVSTALNIIVNAIDNLGYNIIDYKEQNGFASFKVKANETVDALIKTFMEHMKVLTEEYPNYVKIKN